MSVVADEVCEGLGSSLASTVMDTPLQGGSGVAAVMDARLRFHQGHHALEVAGVGEEIEGLDIF